MSEVTYYWNEHHATTKWKINPGNMVDNNIATYAYSWSRNQYNITNTCPGTDLGAISKVEIRFYTEAIGAGWLYFRPYFNGSDWGDQWSPPAQGSPGWTPYHDITEDTNAPDPWTWADVKNLDMKLICFGLSDIAGCSKCEIRVTYESSANPYPTGLLKKGLVSGFHCFLSAYILAKIAGYDPLKLPDGTVF